MFFLQTPLGTRLKALLYHSVTYKDYVKSVYCLPEHFNCL